MKNKIQLSILFLICIISLSVVHAQISTDITSIKCGDKVLDKYNMCEKDIDNRTKCDKMGELLRIDTGCWEQTCACAPKINSVYCGNDRREGAEMCDGTGEDFCEAFGEAIGMELKCIPDQCICEIVGGLPAGYDPNQQEEEEEEEGMAVCGDLKLHSSEECDPPNTLCELEDGSVGICAEGCVCVEKESIGYEEEPVVEENKTQEIQQQEVEEPETKEPEEKEPETKISGEGFFSELWNWFKTIF